MEVAAGAGAICTAGIARGSASALVAPALSLISTLSGRAEVRSRSPCETILGRSIDTDTLERRVAGAAARTARRITGRSNCDVTTIGAQSVVVEPREKST
ncbi:hypothetical protein [Nocardia sp. NPDC004711]